MKVSQAIFSISLFVSSCVMAATQVAPSNRVNLFLDSSSPFSTSDWTIGSTSSLGTVKILKSNPNVEFNILMQMPSNLGVTGSGKRFRLDSINFNGVGHARISDTWNSATGQCVDFAKTMIGSTDPTTKWHPGTKLKNIAKTQLSTELKPGTMIAYFGSSATSTSTYSQIGQHVAIVLNVVTDGSGNPIGINVVHQNYLVSPFSITVNGIAKGAAPQTIAKHYMKWSDTSGLRSAGEYHIVDLY